MCASFILYNRHRAFCDKCKPFKSCFPGIKRHRVLEGEKCVLVASVGEGIGAITVDVMGVYADHDRYLPELFAEAAPPIGRQFLSVLRVDEGDHGWFRLHRLFCGSFWAGFVSSPRTSTLDLLVASVHHMLFCFFFRLGNHIFVWFKAFCVSSQVHKGTHNSQKKHVQTNNLYNGGLHRLSIAIRLHYWLQEFDFARLVAQHRILSKLSLPRASGGPKPT